MSFRRVTVAVASLGWLACAGIVGTRSAPEVEVDGGRLLGSLDDGVAAFSGIPYAAPPLGALRWRPPGPVVRWQGIRDASTYGPQCPQSGRMLENVEGFLEAQGVGWLQRKMIGLIMSNRSVESDEDCLFLNVRTTNLDGTSLEPVMVWIHGGGHQNGSVSMPPYRSNALAERGVVVVTFNYRLGILGFLAHPALTAESPHASSGNYGLLDQIAALTWVRNNIRAFGGDPANVTLFGESSGGHAVGQLMASPLARGLFHRAIAQSGIGSHQLLHLDRDVAGVRTAEAAGLALAEQLGASDTRDPLAALRAASTSELLATTDGDPSRNLAYHPNVDGWVLPKSVAEIFEEGGQAAVPLIIGSNSDEGSLFSPQCFSPLLREVKTLDDYQRGAQLLMGDRAADLKALYPAGDDISAVAACRAMFGDAYFGTNARFAAARMQAAGASAWLYFFTRAPPGAGRAVGAYHGAEVAFVFDERHGVIPQNDYDDALARAIGDYWVQFARKGDPNHAGRPLWPRYDVGDPRWLVLGEEIRAGRVTRSDAYDLFDRVREKRLAPLREARARESAPGARPAGTDRLDPDESPSQTPDVDAGATVE